MSDVSLTETWLAELRGPIHGRIQTLRGMCTDERPHPEIDAKLTELDELVYALGAAIEFPPTEPSPQPQALERELALSKEALLRQIGQLRQRVDYNYPPAAVKEDMQMVRIAYRSWREAHQRYASLRLKEAGTVPDSSLGQSDTSEVLVFDMEQKRPACVLLAAAMGGNPSFAHHFKSESWIVGSDVEGLRRYGPLTHEKVKEIAELLGLAA